MKPSLDSEFYTQQQALRGIADQYNHNRDISRRALILRKLGQLTKINWARVHVIEAGSGPGANGLAVRQLGCNSYLGIDTDEHSVQLATQFGLSALHHNALQSSTGIPGGKHADVVLAIDFLEHLSFTNGIDFLRTAAGWLGHDGVLFLKTPCADSPFFGSTFHGDPTHITAYSTMRLHIACHLAGYATPKIHDHWRIRNSGTWRSPLVVLGQTFVRGASLLASGVNPACLSSDMIAILKPKRGPDPT